MFDNVYLRLGSSSARRDWRRRRAALARRRAGRSASHWLRRSLGLVLWLFLRLFHLFGSVAGHLFFDLGPGRSHLPGPRGKRLHIFFFSRKISVGLRHYSVRRVWWRRRLALLLNSWRRRVMNRSFFGLALFLRFVPRHGRRRCVPCGGERRFLFGRWRWPWPRLLVGSFVLFLGLLMVH
jgi:hypothetical protein